LHNRNTNSKNWCITGSHPDFKYTEEYKFLYLKSQLKEILTFKCVMRSVSMEMNNMMSALLSLIT